MLEMDPEKHKKWSIYACYLGFPNCLGTVIDVMQLER